jgi:hypothetical protein
VLDLNLPSFLWLWKIAAWSMGLALATYGVLFFSGLGILSTRINRQARPPFLRKFHIISGIVLCLLVLLLLAIGLIGTIGYYGSLGHSPHLIAGLTVVVLVLLSGWSATQISPQKSWARLLHVGINLTLLVGFIFVSLTGWQVVQKYLP